MKHVWACIRQSESSDDEPEIEILASREIQTVTATNTVSLRQLFAARSLFCIHRFRRNCRLMSLPGTLLSNSKSKRLTIAQV
jgi:hypothetical protein